MIQCFIGSNETYWTIVDILIISLFTMWFIQKSVLKMYFAFIACQFYNNNNNNIWINIYINNLINN